MVLDETGSPAWVGRDPGRPLPRDRRVHGVRPRPIRNCRPRLALRQAIWRKKPTRPGRCVACRGAALTVTAQRPPVDESRISWPPNAPVGCSAGNWCSGDNLDLDRIQATYRDGVLRLVIPVAERAKPRKISINHGGGTDQADHHRQRPRFPRHRRGRSRSDLSSRAGRERASSAARRGSIHGPARTGGWFSGTTRGFCRPRDPPSAVRSGKSVRRSGSRSAGPVNTHRETPCSTGPASAGQRSAAHAVRRPYARLWLFNRGVAARTTPRQESPHLIRPSLGAVR